MKYIILDVLKFIKRSINFKLLSVNWNKKSNLIQDKFLTTKRKVLLIQTPEHKNLGDHAIAYAEKIFVEDNLKECEIIEIPYNDVYKLAKSIKKFIEKDDLIIIIGGGNMGDMYVYEEYMRRFIIKTFNLNKIISFPQTIDFSNTIYGKLERLKSKRIYSKHNNLVVVARETKSYNNMKKLYSKNKVILTPDIVLYLNFKFKYNRSGIITCLRNDLEKEISNQHLERLREMLKSNYSKTQFIDTVINHDVICMKRKEILERFWENIAKAEIVITDRLHGMIFCAITNTPCIVFKNSNHKIEQSYNDWLKDIEFIRLCNFEEINNLIEIIEEVKNIKPTKKLNIDKFNVLIEELIN